MVGGDNGLVNEQFRASLAWLDVPAFAGATEVLINNLDLTVTNARTKETYLGNGALYNNTADRANTLEQVTIAALALEAGPHAARQRARHRLHAGDQHDVCALCHRQLPGGDVRLRRLCLLPEPVLGRRQLQSDQRPLHDVQRRLQGRRLLGGDVGHAVLGALRRRRRAFASRRRRRRAPRSRRRPPPRRRRR
jgi:hypothetical protein